MDDLNDDTEYYDRFVKKKFLRRTYFVTIAMLLLGQFQVMASMQITELKDFFEKYYFISLLQFFISFISLQLYVFFFHIIERKSMWLRVFAALWTYESNTLCVMKPTKSAPMLSLIISFVLVYVMMGVGVLIANLSCNCRKKYELNRNKLILWSERIFVVTSFGIIVCAEMQRLTIEIVMLTIYALISNVFVIIFAISIREENFYDRKSVDWMLIGQLYYLNVYALYMSYVWTFSTVVEMIFGENYSFFNFL